jgi:hypothetical protein
MEKPGRPGIIRPECILKTLPFDVRRVKLPITQGDILETIRESRAKFS